MTGSVSLTVKKVAGGGRNVTYHITGVVTDGADELTPIDLDFPNLKLASMAWLIQEKMGLYLHNSDKQIVMPLESRNSLKLDVSYQDLGSKIYLSVFDFYEGEPDYNEHTVRVWPLKKVFFLVLDFDK